MRLIAGLLGTALAAYSITLIGIELSAGGAAVRPFLEDPASNPRFAAVNTTLSTGLLWGAAILFLGTWRARRSLGYRGPREEAFLALQFLFFLGLGLDERFRLVPLIAHDLGMTEPPLYAAIGMAEASVLVLLGRVLDGPRIQVAFALLAAAAYGAALGCDSWLPFGFPLRRTAEDLPKVWGGAAILLFAWWRLTDVLDEAGAKGRPASAWLDGAAFDFGRDAGSWGPGSRRNPSPATVRLTELADPSARRPDPAPGKPAPKKPVPKKKGVPAA